MNANRAEIIRDYAGTVSEIRTEIAKCIVGQEAAIDSILITLIAGGHALLEGVPGIAKTLLVTTVARCTDCSFARIQFTPDLLPADITGTRIYNMQKGSFETLKGPIFHNIVLADEINRAPPRVQSALLEAMQEYQVTIHGETWPIGRPFFVLATQNPIESEGTYPLPNAQTDRFMQKILMDYPSKSDELEIMARFTAEKPPEASKIITREKIGDLHAGLHHVYADETVMEYVAGITDSTRNPGDYVPDIAGYVRGGASPRASLALILCAKAAALIDSREHITPDDVRSVALPVLRHRILLSYQAEAAGVTPDELVSRLIDAVEVP
ncbi:MAG TPA: MoxR family ATPase [Methanoculleus sp.]|nr:MoxR family ATPase [Methanoculleus sp.]